MLTVGEVEGVGRGLREWNDAVTDERELGAAFDPDNGDKHSLQSHFRFNRNKTKNKLMIIYSDCGGTRLPVH